MDQEAQTERIPGDVIETSSAWSLVPDGLIDVTSEEPYTRLGSYNWKAGPNNRRATIFVPGTVMTIPLNHSFV